MSLAQRDVMHYYGHMTLNIRETGENPFNVWPEADMAVTFMDGKTIVYKNVRVLGMLGYDDPVKVDGTNMEIETEDTVFHLLGVRQYVCSITRDGDGTYR